MKRNVGGLDRLLRLAVGLALLVVGYRYRRRTAGTVAFIAGSDVLASGVLGRCPMNALLGIDTCGES
ncbi:YgaP family membrane protein [Natrononativus amylolyticus]|uniref:YgaP family membrane protein n=1 Tax=Natrononativus amylolyticus TaxID=2963434 RepID=UPI0020CCA843|nr:DUF2892 domain-containing protein [Natrononativus amylolyticus]